MAPQIGDKLEWKQINSPPRTSSISKCYYSWRHYTGASAFIFQIPMKKHSTPLCK